MLRKLVLFLIWITFVLYTVRLAPLDQPDTWPLVQKLLTLQWHQVNAVITAIFALMGVWPMIYACLMFADGRMQPFRAWPYFLGSNFTGVICLLPYLIWRRSGQPWQGRLDAGLRLLEHRLTAIALLLSTLGLLLYAGVAGDWSDYWHQFQTRRFVHLISLDFSLMGLIFPLSSLLDDDMARRGWSDRRIFWAVALVPLFGPLLYLCCRPPLQVVNRGNPDMRSLPSSQAINPVS